MKNNHLDPFDYAYLDNDKGPIIIIPSYFNALKNNIRFYSTSLQSYQPKYKKVTRSTKRVEEYIYKGQDRNDEAVWPLKFIIKRFEVLHGRSATIEDFRVLTLIDNQTIQPLALAPTQYDDLIRTIQHMDKNYSRFLDENNMDLMYVDLSHQYFVLWRNYTEPMKTKGVRITGYNTYKHFRETNALACLEKPFYQPNVVEESSMSKEEMPLTDRLKRWAEEDEVTRFKHADLHNWLKYETVVTKRKKLVSDVDSKSHHSPSNSDDEAQPITNLKKPS